MSSGITVVIFAKLVLKVKYIEIHSFELQMRE